MNSMDSAFVCDLHFLGLVLITNTCNSHGFNYISFSYSKKVNTMIDTCLEMRLTAPLEVRGGKNSSENQRSPDSILLRILSRRRSDERSASSTGVEQRELSLELSPLLLLAPLESLLLLFQVPSTRWTWFTMVLRVYWEET